MKYQSLFSGVLLAAIAAFAFSSTPVQAAFSGGIDTLQTAGDLPLGVNGTQVIDLQPNLATIYGNVSISGVITSPLNTSNVLTVNQNWDTGPDMAGKTQALSMNSNQIWKSQIGGDGAMYLQWSNPDGAVVIGGQTGTTNNHLYVHGGLETYHAISSAFGGSAQIIANGDDHAGGGIQISDDGAFYDYNDGWVTYNGSTGLKIAGNNGAASGGALFQVNGIMSTSGFDPNDLPSGWGGGIRTWDIYASGSIGVGTGNHASPNTQMTNSGVYAPAYYHTSDMRLKTNIQPVEHALDKLLSIRGVEFNWKKDGRGDMGVVAQDVQKVFPNVVSKTENGYMTVEYDSLVGPMIEAMRELKSENQNLKKHLAEVEARLDAVDQDRGSVHHVKATPQDSFHQGRDE